MTHDFVIHYFSNPIFTVNLDNVKKPAIVFVVFSIRVYAASIALLSCSPLVRLKRPPIWVMGQILPGLTDYLQLQSCPCKINIYHYI